MASKVLTPMGKHGFAQVFSAIIRAGVPWGNRRGGRVRSIGTTCAESGRWEWGIGESGGR